MGQERDASVSESMPTVALDAESPELPGDDVLVGGRYRRIRALGRGGMGAVWEVEDCEIGTRVALKLVRGAGWDVRTASQVKSEIQLARRVTHPNVCRTHDLGTHRDADGRTRPFLTMELVEGETLAARLDREGRLAPAEAERIATQIAAALDAAHAAGVVHRDLSARNVMIEASTRRVVVTDFGLALESRFVGVGVGSRAGTPATMAPEQVEGGAVTPSADVYALGVVMMQMVTGRLPFDADDARALAEERLRRAPIAPRAIVPSLDVRWDEVVLRCLARDPKARFASAGEAVRALRAPRRARVIGGALVFLVVLVVTAMVWSVRAREARAARVEELVQAAHEADYRAGETLAREALALDPTSRPARHELARVLFDRSRLATTGRSEALAEGRAIASELVREDESDIAARDQLVTGLYLAGDRLEALAQLPRLSEERGIEIRPRIEWSEGWLSQAHAGLTRCLAVLPHDLRCLMLHQFDVELERGRQGLEELLADPSERDYSALARVRMRILVGRVDEAVLVSETGFANGQLDAIDAPYVHGLIAAARHDDAAAAREQASLEALVVVDDGPLAPRYAGAVQLAELAALRGDVEGLVRAATLALELGYYNADVWERSVPFAPYRDRLASVAARCREHADADLARARERHLSLD